jgi:phosphate transport system permease protein
LVKAGEISLTQEVRAADVRRPIVLLRGPADRAYRLLSTTAGLLTLAILVLIGLFLTLEAMPAFRAVGFSFFTTSVWEPDAVHPKFGIAAVMYWTAVIAVISLVIALVVSLPCALLITEYAPPRFRRVLTGIVDLLAAIPSIIYGLWGLLFLEGNLVAFPAWLNQHLSFIPIFQSSGVSYAGSAFMAGAVVSLMVMPICTSVMREVFSQTPPGEKEAALALGGTRWAMIRAVVIPFGLGGIIGGAMLGLGRALGETIAVAMIISPSFLVNLHWVGAGANSIAALIALQFGEASPNHGIPALMAGAVTLFGVTLVVNLVASMIVARSRSGKGVEI